MNYFVQNPKRESFPRNHLTDEFVVGKFARSTCVRSQKILSFYSSLSSMGKGDLEDVQIMKATSIKRERMKISRIFYYESFAAKQ